MCYTQRNIQGGVGALRESNDTNFFKPNGQSRNLNVHVYGINLLTLFRGRSVQLLFFADLYAAYSKL